MELLKLNNQLCFPIYTAAKLLDKIYKPLLDKFGFTYIQYLSILVLLEEKECTIKQLSERLTEPEFKILPCLIDLEHNGYVIFHKEGDEILKIIPTEFCYDLKQDISCIPKDLIASSGFSIERLHALQLELFELVKNFNSNDETDTI